MKVLSATVERYYDEDDGNQAPGAFEYEPGDGDMTYNETLGCLIIKRNGCAQAICIPRERIISMEVEF